MDKYDSIDRDCPPSWAMLLAMAFAAVVAGVWLACRFVTVPFRRRRRGQ